MLTLETKDLAPLKKSEVLEVFNLTARAESFFGSPQDVEWTYRGDVLYLLQSRPMGPVLVVGEGGLEGIITLENFGELIEISQSLRRPERAG